MTLQSFLHWVMQFVLPLLGWRVPVRLLRGTAPGSGRAVALLSAGGGSDFIFSHFFAAEPQVVRSVRVPVWRLQRVLDAWRAEADLTLVRVDRLSARWFLSGRGIVVPEWVNSWMTLPADWREFARTHKNASADLRRVRIKKFDCEISRSAQDFDEFYDRYYLPFVTARHGTRAGITPRWRLRMLFRQGLLLWVRLNGERVACSLAMVKGRRYFMLCSGVLDGRMDLLKQGAISSEYVLSFQTAASLGCTEVHMGGTLPSLHDGIFRYKSKWSSGLSAHEGFVSGNMVMQMEWSRLEGAVAEFLSRTSLIYHDGDAFSALWVFPSDLPLTADTLQQEYARLHSRSLHRFRILLPGEPPADFECPPEVRLASLASVAHYGSAQLLSAMP